MEVNGLGGKIEADEDVVSSIKREISEIPIDEFLQLRVPKWDGDKYFIPLLLESRQMQFHGVMPYQGGNPVSWSFNWL